MHFSFYIRLYEESWLLSVSSCLLNVFKADHHQVEKVGVVLSVAFLTLFIILVPISFAFTYTKITSLGD